MPGVTILSETISSVNKIVFFIDLCVGIAMLIFIYVSVNTLMTIGFAPVVGVPLPFYSYGGSSFITFMCLFGIIQNLITFRYDPEYNKLLKIKF